MARVDRRKVPYGLLLLVLALATATAAEVVPAATAAQKAAKPDGLPPIIPLRLLLGNSKYRNPQLSPDGKNLAYIRPSGAKDVYNVFIKQLPLPAQTSTYKPDVSLFDQQGVGVDREITFDQKRGVTAYSWAEDGSAIFYIQDNNGDENDHLYMVPLSSSTVTNSLNNSVSNSAVEPIDLTPFKGVKASGIVGSKRFPDKLYIGLNRRAPEVFDMYSLDLKTGKLVLDTINPGDVTSWLFDYDFKIKGAIAYNNTDGNAYVIIKDTPAAQQATKPVPAAAASQPPNKKITMEKTTTKPGKPSAGSSSKPTTTTSSTTTSNSSSNSSSNPAVAELEALFQAAARDNYTTAQWIAASSSKSDGSKWRRLLEWPFGEDGGVFRFNKAGDALYVVSSLGRDTTELQLISTAAGAPIKQRIASNPLVNVGSVLFEPDEWYPQMISFNYLKPNWTVLDPAIQPDWDKVSGFRPGDQATINDVSNDKKTWVVVYSGDNKTSRYYLYRKGSWPPQLLFEVQPALNPYKLAKMQPVIITARDGLRLPAYLSLPMKPGVPSTLPASVAGRIPDVGKTAASPDGVHFGPKPAAAVPAAKPLNLNLPMVLYVHGGPWSRDYWGADSVVQWLANRGYAVLQVNYRGSTGFGKNFMNAGNGQWGVGSMQHDLTDAVSWAVAQGIADPKRVCIMGGSYGGYATLAGLAFTPELYRCGVDLVGISNVGTFMRSIPPYWKPLRYEWATRVGDAENNQTLNRMISPFYHVASIKAPLLIGQGANDPRVPQAESDQMFAAMKSLNLDVQYVLYPDEGHGLVIPANRLDFYSRADQFLAKHLGGRSEPQLEMAGSSGRVITQVPATPRSDLN